MDEPRRGKSSRGRGRPGKPAPVRRAIPPESTGDEWRYLGQVKAAKRPVVIRLRDGSDVDGIIESFDRDTIELRRDNGPQVFIRKADIRYLSD